LEVRDIVPQTLVTIAPGDTLKRAMSLMTSHRCAAFARVC
jgi:CBS domain-containing protein